jgi:hypothetical protein
MKIDAQVYTVTNKCHLMTLRDLRAVTKTLCCLVEIYGRFERIFCLNLQGS